MGTNRRFRYPLPVCPRVAVFCERFAGAPNLLILPELATRIPAVFEAQTFAVPARSLRRIQPLTPRVTYPVVVLTGPEYGFLTELDRDWIWRHFQAPVFEQLWSASGDLLAEECDAHSGLHLLAKDSLWNQTVPAAEEDSCPCGRPEPILHPEYLQSTLALAS